MKQAALRWTRRLLVLGACAGLLAAAAHTPWVRGAVLSRLTSGLSARTGFDFSAEALDYNLFTLTATVDGLQISRRGSPGPPLLRVRTARFALSARVIGGVVDAERVDADGVALVIDLRKPPGGAPASKRAAGAPFRVPVFAAGRAVIRHADVDVIDPGGLGHLKVRDATLDVEGGVPRRLEGAIVVAGGLTLDSDDTHVRIDRLEGRAFLDGDTIGARPASAAAGGRRVALEGSLTLTGPSPGFDLGLAGDLDVAMLASWFPAMPAGSGPLGLTGRVTGPLADPTFSYAVRSSGVSLPDIRVPASSAEGTISRAGIAIDRMKADVGGGWVEATGRLPLGPVDPNSRFVLRWSNVAIADLAQVFPLLPKDPVGMVATGSARVHWSGSALEFSTVAGEVTSDLRFAPGLPPARVRMDGAAGKWILHGEQRLDGGTVAGLDATIAINPADVENSPVAGSLRVASPNLRPVMAEAREAFADLPDVSAWLRDSPLTLVSTIDGTLGEPRVSGTAASDSLRIFGLPPLEASAAFAIDAARLTVSKASADDGAGNRFEGSGGVEFDTQSTAGTFSASVTNPEPLLNALLGSGGNPAALGALKAGGSAVVAGTWHGSVDDPAVSVTASARDVSVANATAGVEHATLDGRVDGPISDPEAALRVTAGALRAASLQPVPAVAELSLKAGRLDATAHVPDWSASLTGHLSTAAPREFAAEISIRDLAAARLITLLGGQQDAASAAEGTFSATLEAAGRADDRRLHLTGQAALAGGALRVGGSRLIDGVDAAMEARDGRWRLSSLSGRAFDGPLAATGDLPLSWVEALLPDGWRVDGAAVPEGPASFEVRAEPDVKTVGTWLRPDEPGHMTGSLRLRMTGEASAASVDAIDGRIVLEPGTVTVRDVAFTLPRAASIRVEGGRASVEECILTAPGTTASASGTMGLTGDRAIDAGVTASGALGFLSSIVPGRVAGAFNAAFRITGHAVDPQLSGRLALDDAAWVWPEQRLALRDWSGEAIVTADALTIERLGGHVNGGEASLTGAIRFGGGGGAGLHLSVSDAMLEVVKGFRSQADADLTLASSGEGARLSGNVTVTSGAYREPVTAMAKLFSAQAAAPAAPAGTSPLLGAIALDVELTASSPIVIENSAGRLDLVPSMKLQGSLAEPALLGSLDMVDDGRLTLRGRSFRLTEARVVFQGAGDPAVQLVGETRVGEYVVMVRTNGPVAELATTYTSEPPLSERDLQSLLVTGRTTDVAGTKSGNDQEFVLGTASSDVLGLAGGMVGLDTVQLGRADFELGASDVDQAMRLTASKNVSARTRLVLSQNLDDNKLTWIVVYTPRRGYEIRISQRDNLEEVVEFRQEVSFGPGVSPPSTQGPRKRLKGPRVASLEFTGDLGHPASELESVVKLKPRKEFDAGTWQQDRARLEAFYRNRGRASARIVPGRTVVKDGPTDRILLKYRVDPGPRTILGVSGVELSDGDRRALMQTWSESVLPEFLDEDLSKRLRDLLAERDLLRPSIDVTVETSDPDVVVANVVVTPGPVTRTRRLAIEGALAVAEPELRDALSGHPALETMWTDQAPLVEAVAGIYAERGYPSASVVADGLAFDGDTTECRLRIVEGPQSVVQDVVFAGVADARKAGALEAVALRTGQPLLPGMELDARRRLERFYLDHGFRSASVRSSASAAADGRASLAFSVIEGPVSVVSTVGVKGLDGTKPGVAEGSITLKAGDPAGQAGVIETQRRLYGLGVFRRADVTFEPAPKAQAADQASVPVDMTVSLEEARRFQLRYGVQLSNEYGPVLEDFSSAVGVAADIRDRNFLGRAFALGVSTRIEKNLQSLRGQFSLPALLHQRLHTSLFGTIRSETDTSDEQATYTDQERDITFEQRLRLPHNMEVAWGYGYNVRDVVLVEERRTDSTPMNGALGTVNGTFVIDKRDKPFNASRGWFQSSNVQWGVQNLGSDLSYVRLLLRQFYYKPAGPFVFASGVRWGWMDGISGEPPVTILDRFFDAGGAQTVRGYEEESLSAVEVAGFPVGGTKLLILNQEVRFPLFSRWLQGAVFVDAGNTFAPNQAIALDALAVGAGFGIRIMTPFAPIRIDVGYPFNKRPDDRSYQFYFSIGQIF